MSITVIDTEAPVFLPETCPTVSQQRRTHADFPQAVDVQLENGANGTEVPFSLPVARDNDRIATVESTANPFDFFPAGETDVVFRAIDPSGNTAVCAFVVTVGQNFQTSSSLLSGRNLYILGAIGLLLALLVVVLGVLKLEQTKATKFNFTEMLEELKTQPGVQIVDENQSVSI